MGKVMTIGIAGGTGSGKTTITRRLQQRFADNVSVIYHDNYYKAHNDMTYEERSKLNYDCPDAFDTELMVRDLTALRAGHSVRCPVYDYTVHNRSDKTVLVNPSPVIIVEGILIFQDPRLCELLDIKMHTPPHSPRRARPRPQPLERGGPVPHHGQAHARDVCGAQQAQRRHHHPRGRA